MNVMSIVKRTLVVAMAALSGLAVAATPARAGVVDYELKNHWYWPDCLDLDVWNPGKVQLWGCNNSPQQRWFRGNAYDGWAELRSRQDARCLTLDPAAPVGDGSRMQVADCGGPGQPDQHWRLERQEGNAYRLVNRRYGCLDVDRNEPYFLGKRVQAGTCTWTGYQLWEAVKHTY